VPLHRIWKFFCFPFSIESMLAAAKQVRRVQVMPVKKVGMSLVELELLANELQITSAASGTTGTQNFVPKLYNASLIYGDRLMMVTEEYGPSLLHVMHMFRKKLTKYRGTHHLTMRSRATSTTTPASRVASLRRSRRCMMQTSRTATSSRQTLCSAPAPTPRR
jgi:hypothetical protein